MILTTNMDGGGEKESSKEKEKEKDYSIVKTQCNNNTNLTINKALSPRQDANMKYINMMIHKKHKKDRENELTFQENERKKLAICTFKPKTNSSTVVLTRESLNDTTKLTHDQKIEILHQKHTTSYKNKDDKNQDLLRFEKDKKDYTFKPCINEG